MKNNNLIEMTASDNNKIPEVLNDFSCNGYEPSGFNYVNQNQEYLSKYDWYFFLFEFKLRQKLDGFLTLKYPMIDISTINLTLKMFVKNQKIKWTNVVIGYIAYGL